MKSAVLSALVAISTMAPSISGAQTADGCVAYGDTKTDFTWRLCPAGEKYERQYLYFGVWGNFYRVNSATGACNWSPAGSSWVCPDRTIRCNAARCG
jgi:hypothetical protein